jgi:hypothetical protein
VTALPRDQAAALEHGQGAAHGRPAHAEPSLERALAREPAVRRKLGDLAPERVG